MALSPDRALVIDRNTLRQHFPSLSLAALLPVGARAYLRARFVAEPKDAQAQSSDRACSLVVRENSSDGV